MSSPAPIPATQQQVRDAYSTLYDSLNTAYWYASNIDDKDRIRGLAEGAYDIMSRLNADDIRSRTADYVALKAQVEKVNARLVKLQADVDQIIHSVSVASGIVSAIATAIQAVGAFAV